MTQHCKSIAAMMLRKWENVIILIVRSFAAPTINIANEPENLRGCYFWMIILQCFTFLDFPTNLAFVLNLIWNDCTINWYCTHLRTPITSARRHMRVKKYTN